MYKHKLQFDSQLFQAGMTVPANTTATGTSAVRGTGAPGNLAITVTAASAVALALGTVLNITFTTSATEAGVFAAPARQPSMAVTFAAAVAADEGEVLGSLIIPTGYFESENLDEKWVKAVVGTDDAAATGTVDVFLEYLAN